MAKTVIGAEIVVNGKQAEQSVGNFKKALKEANQELVGMTEKFGATSNAAIMAAKKVAGLKDAIGDARDLANSFNPDAKFASFGGAIQGVAAGFSVAQGAMAAFGGESKETEKILLKVQAAMALSQGLNGIMAAKDAFINLGAVIKSSTLFQKSYEAATIAAAAVQRLFTGAVVSTSTSFKVLRTAIISTGIGALVVGIGMLVGKIMEWTSSNDGAADSQDRLKKATDELNKSVNNSLETRDQENQLIIKKAKLAGESEATIQKLEEMAIEHRIRRREAEIQIAIKQGLDITELSNKNITDNNAIDNLRLDHRQSTLDKMHAAEQQAAAARTADNNKALAEQKAFNKAALDLEKELQIEIANSVRTDEQKDIAEAERKFILRRDILIKGNQSIFDAEVAHLIALAEIKAKYAPASPEQTDEIDPVILANMAKMDSDKQVTLSEEVNAEARKAIKQAEFDAAVDIADKLGGLAEKASGLLGKHTAAGKVLAIASTTIDTFKSATSAFAGMTASIPGPVGIAAGVAAAALAVAAGIANVKKIIAVKVPGAGGGSAPSGVSMPAPVTPTLSRTTLDQSSINGIGSATSGRAFVLDRDIAGNRERAVRLNRAARIN